MCLSTQITNCINCGAPLTSTTCGYCGTVYKELMEHARLVSKDSRQFTVALDNNGTYGVLNFCGCEYEVYVAEVVAEYVGDSYRDDTGMMHTSKQGMKHAFKLIEI